tara:strand:- start:778 stop:1245 length:468 start_codon:yes stop_codon:yes gene_type:complete
MSSSFYTGRHGSLLLEGVKVAQVQNWTLNTSVSLLSTKTLGETDDQFIVDSRNTSGSCRVLYYADGANSAGRFISKVIKARDGDNQNAPLFQGDDVAGEEERSDLRLKVDDGSADGRYIQMRVFITNITLTMAVGEIFAADISFQSHGAPNLVNL